MRIHPKLCTFFTSPPADVICVVRSRKKTILSLYSDIRVQTKHAQNEKHFNSTKRNNIKRRTRAIYYWYYNTRSSPADVKQSKRSRVYHRTIQNFSNYLPFGNDAKSENYPDAKIQPKSQDYLLKIQDFCNLSLVSLSIHPRSRRGAQRIRKGEGRWSRPPKTFTCSIRSSPADIKQNKQTLKPCRRQAKQTLEYATAKFKTLAPTVWK